MSHPVDTGSITFIQDIFARFGYLNGISVLVANCLLSKSCEDIILQLKDERLREIHRGSRTTRWAPDSEAVGLGLCGGVFHVFWAYLEK